MPFKGKNKHSSRRDERTEPRRQTQPPGGLSLDDDFEATVKKNVEFIKQLREENKNLRKQLAEVERRDARVALTRTSSEFEAFLKMSPKERTEALSKLEHEVLLKTRCLNAERDNLKASEQRFDEMKRDVSRRRPEARNGAGSVDVHALKEVKDTMEVRVLENRLEKMLFKCQREEGLVNSYQKLRNHMQDESLTYQSQLDSLETELLKHRGELQQLLVKYEDIQLSTDAAEAELQQQQELLHKQHEERKSRIPSSFKEREERDADGKNVEMTIPPTQMVQPDDKSSEAQPRPTCTPGEEDQVPSSFQEMLRRLQESKDLQEITESYISQKETHDALEKMKKENEKVRQQLREQKQQLMEEFENMKCSMEVGLLSQQQELEECKEQLKAQQQRYTAAKERRDQLMKTFLTVQAGVEHLSRKLQHIHLNEDVAQEGHPGSDEKVVELVKQLELKSQILLSEVDVKDLAALQKEMEESEFWDTIQREMPEYNTRVKVPEDHNTDLPHEICDTEVEHEDDEADVI